MKKNCLEEYHICILNVCQSHAFIDFSCLVKETIGRVMTFEKTMLRVLIRGFCEQWKKVILNVNFEKYIYTGWERSFCDSEIYLFVYFEWITVELNFLFCFYYLKRVRIAMTTENLWFWNVLEKQRGGLPEVNSCK